mmetsp:Transcript_32337/g.60870  ORF Transcript_32337/g.60870 Transcript_32337/m.60870 type:complete len:112 (+) Transcript_32337:86-421(+)
MGCQGSKATAPGVVTGTAQKATEVGVASESKMSTQESTASTELNSMHTDVPEVEHALEQVWEEVVVGLDVDCEDASARPRKAPDSQEAGNDFGCGWFTNGCMIKFPLQGDV